MPQNGSKQGKKDSPTPSKVETSGAQSTSTETLLLQMLKLMQDKEDKRALEEEKRRQQEEERYLREQERHRKEEERRKQDEDRRFQAIMQAFSQHTAPSTASNSTQQPAILPSTSSQQKRPTTSMPSKLLPDVTFTSFKHWKRGWEDFSLTAGITSLPQDHQLAYLRQALSSDMQCILRNNIGVEDDSTLPIDNIIGKIEDYFKSQRNQALRRLNYNRCRQKQGEDLMPFIARLRQNATDADLCDKCRDTRIFDSIVSGITGDYEELRVKLLAMKPETTLDEAIAFCSSYDSAHKTSAEVMGNKSLSSVSQYSKNKKNFIKTQHQEQDHSKGKPQKGKLQAQNRDNASDNCHKCGNKKHAGDTQCPARGQRCDNCKKIGHFTSVCRARSNKAKGVLNPVISSVTLGNISSKLQYPPAPRIDVDIHYNKTVKKLKFIPDTGAETSAIDIKQLRSLGISTKDLHPSLSVPFYAANGTNIRVLGRIQVMLSYRGSRIRAWIDV